VKRCSWHHVAAALLVAGAAFLQGCGGGGGGSDPAPVVQPPPPPPPPPPAPAPTAPYANAYGIPSSSITTSEDLRAWVQVEPGGYVVGYATNFVDGIVNELAFSGVASFNTAGGTWTLPGAVVYTYTSTFYIQDDLPSTTTTVGTITGGFTAGSTLTFTLDAPPRPAGLPRTIAIPVDPAPSPLPALAALAGRYVRTLRVGPSVATYADFTVGADGRLAGHIGCTLLEGSTMSILDAGSKTLSATLVLPDCDIGRPAGTYRAVGLIAAASPSGRTLSFTSAGADGRVWSFSGSGPAAN